MVKRIATALVLIPLVLLLVLKAPLYVLAIICGIVAALAIAEFLKLVTPYGIQPLAMATYFFVALFFGVVVFACTNATPEIETTAMLYGIVVASALAPFVFLTVAMRRSDLRTGYPAAAASSFAFAYIAIPMALLIGIRQLPAGAIWTIYTLLAVGGDIFAYLLASERPSLHVARHHPEENMGVRDSVDPREHYHRHALDSARARNQFCASAHGID
jgi:CDP-diglyceride synthetase